MGRETDTTYFIGSSDGSNDLVTPDVDEIMDYSLGDKPLRECVHDIIVEERTL